MLARRRTCDKQRIAEREEHELDQHGDDQDREAEIADQMEQVAMTLNIGLVMK